MLVISNHSGKGEFRLLIRKYIRNRIKTQDVPDIEDNKINKEPLQK